MRGTKKIDWLNHGLEFLMVVVGILIAFQLNTCSENKKNQAVIDQHIVNLIEECEFNLKMVNNIIEKTQEASTNLNQLMGLIQKGESWDQVNGLTLQQLDYTAIYLKNNAYNSLIQSGDIRNVKDFNLKNDIINLYEYYTWTQSYERVNGEVFAGYFLPYVMTEFDMFALSTQSPEVYTNQRFKNALGSMSYQMNARLAKYIETRDEITQFLEKYRKSQP